MISYRAAWVLPIDDPPLRDGVVAVDRGVIVSVGSAVTDSSEDLGDVVLLPGLVNAHTHLELSWMRDRVPPSASMPAWAAALIALRQTTVADAKEAIAAAIGEARGSGSCAFGDISNSLASFEPLAAAGVFARVFQELLGFSPQDPAPIVDRAIERAAALPQTARLKLALAPHAPYSVSPALFAAIARTAAGPLSVHLGESVEEVQFLRDGSGAWRQLLERLGVWNAGWTPPGCGPVAYLDRLGLLTPNVIAVHGVQLTDPELSMLAAAGATLVTCPRSNQWTGAGRPPIARFYASGVRVAVGTDSLASVQDLNLFSELAEIRRLAPSVEPRAILRSATRAGAEALGFARELGSLAPGKQAEILAVRVPPDVTDVEEYLVSGIQPFDIRWVEVEP